MGVIEYRVKTRPKVLRHKLRDGRRSDGRYCYWTRKRGYARLRDALAGVDDHGEPWIWGRTPRMKHHEVRLVIIIDDEVKGYFRTFGASNDLTELWFHSEDWVEAEG